MTMVIITITVTALISALASTTASAKSHRDIVVADSAIRNAAEAVKLAATGCQTGGSVITAFVWPTGFTHTVIVDGTTLLDNSGATSDTIALTCPPGATTSLVKVVVSTPAGTNDSTELRVRTP